MTKDYIGSILLALAVLMFWALTLPFYNQVSDLDIAIKDRKDVLESRTAIIEKIKNLNKEYQKRTSEIAKLSAIVPSKKSVAEVLSAVNDVSIKSGIGLTSLSIIGQQTPDSNVNPYNILSLEINLSGSYPGLNDFLKALEKNLRLVDITSIDGAIGTQGNSSILNFVIKGNAYYLK